MQPYKVAKQGSNLAELMIISSRVDGIAAWLDALLKCCLASLQQLHCKYCVVLASLCMPLKPFKSH
jgi:hypothetical protein